jgi:hypothetical protein
VGASGVDGVECPVRVPDGECGGAGLVQVEFVASAGSGQVDGKDPVLQGGPGGACRTGRVRVGGESDLDGEVGGDVGCAESDTDRH